MGMRIKWEKDGRVVDFLKPGAQGKCIIAKELPEFFKSDKFAKYCYGLRRFARERPQADLFSVTTQELKSFASKYYSRGDGKNLFNSLSRFAKWKLGMKQSTASVNDRPISPTIMAADISQLAELLSRGKYNGPLGPFKLSILESLRDCPANQFRTIPWIKEWMSDRKEMLRAMAAVRDVVKREPVLAKDRWVCKQSPLQKCFFIVRGSDYLHVKELLKRGGVNASGLLNRNGSGGQGRKDQKENKRSR